MTDLRDRKASRRSPITHGQIGSRVGCAFGYGERDSDSSYLDESIPVVMPTRICDVARHLVGCTRMAIRAIRWANGGGVSLHAGSEKTCEKPRFVTACHLHLDRADRLYRTGGSSARWP